MNTMLERSCESGKQRQRVGFAAATLLAAGLVAAGCGGANSPTSAPSPTRPQTAAGATSPSERTPATSTSRSGTQCTNLNGPLAASMTRTRQFRGLVETSLADGCVAYVNDRTTLYLEFIRGPHTGETKQIGSTNAELFDLALSPSGLLYGVDGSGVFYTVNRETGAATARGSGVGYFTNGLVFSSAGAVYGSGYERLLTIDPTTGAGSLIGQATGFDSSGDLAFTPSGRLYMTGSGDDLVSLDPKTGAGKLVGPIGRRDVYGLCDSFGTFYGVDLGGELLTINARTGAATTIAKGGPEALGMTIAPAQTK